MRVGTGLMPFAGVEFLLLLLSCPTSVASGVNGLLETSSLLPNISLLCALEKDGYEVLGRASLVLNRRSISGTVALSFLDGRSGRSNVVALGESLFRSPSLLLDRRLPWDLEEARLV